MTDDATVILSGHAGPALTAALVFPLANLPRTFLRLMVCCVTHGRKNPLRLLNSTLPLHKAADNDYSR